MMQDKRFEIMPTSELEEFMSIIKDDRRTANIDPDILKLLFDRVREFLALEGLETNKNASSATSEPRNATKTSNLIATTAEQWTTSVPT